MVLHHSHSICLTLPISITTILQRLSLGPYIYTRNNHSLTSLVWLNRQCGLLLEAVKFDLSPLSKAVNFGLSPLSKSQHTVSVTLRQWKLPATTTQKSSRVCVPRPERTVAVPRVAHGGLQSQATVVVAEGLVAATASIVCSGMGGNDWILCGLVMTVAVASVGHCDRSGGP